MDIDSIIKKAESLFNKFDNILHKKKRSDAPDLLIPGEDFLKLKSKYYSYKNLLLKNNELLSTLSDVEENIRTGTITLQTFRAYLARIFDTAFGFIQSLNDMAENKYTYLYDILERIRTDIDSGFTERPAEELRDMVIPLERISKDSFKDTGSKAGNLGELRNRIGLPVPKGFAITVGAYRDFISANNLNEKINSLIASLDISDITKTEQASKEIKQMIISSEVPSHIKQAIEKEVQSPDSEKGYSVRSSAVGEDGKLSFAGQFRSILNVKAEAVADAYKEVLASKYSSRAMFYRMAKGIKDKDMPMAVCVLEMVDSRSSGVLYTLNPGQPEKEETLISSVWGQGQYAVGGTISPDIFILDRKNKGRIASSTVSDKQVKLILDESGGTKEVPVAKDKIDMPSISEKEISRLYDLSCLIEKNFGEPQDIEWTIDEHGHIIFLQSRPLKVMSTKRPASYASPSPVSGQNVVLAEGESASGGIASGKVHIIDSIHQVADVPHGSVLVAKRSSNELVKIMPRVAAILVESGSKTTHLATVAREFNVPLIMNIRNVKGNLRNKVVTVDANTGRVYEGKVHASLLSAGQPPADIDPEYGEPIKKAMKMITPLNLVTIEKGDIAPEEIKTIHDIIRFVHEFSVREMFSIGEFSEHEGFTHQLLSDSIPMYFYVIDLDGGLVEEAKFLKKITPEHITSVPFKALWKGMTNERVRWSGPVDIDMGGLASVMARSFVRTGVSEKGGKAYVIATDQYLNLSVKLAYHFTVFDAFCGESYINNYINFR
ncbi:MAG TPA: hypothetical protein ENH40_00205, partial [Nitrospirae bacterium]|nr:hypothetical protein [Nitrospirota bacterium]